MSGQGKGVLRIAIEDFFTTSKIGKWIAAWFKDFGEDQEQAIYDVYKDLPNKVIAWSKNIYDVIPRPTGASGQSKQGGILTAGAFAGQIGMSAASSFMGPLNRIINYRMDQVIQSARLDPSALAALNWKKPELAQQFKNDLTEQGWSDQRVSAWIEAMSPLLAVGDIITMFHRNMYTEAQAKQEIGKQGFNLDQADKLIKLGLQIPNVQDLIRLAVREAFSPDIIAKFQYDQGYPGLIDEYLKAQGLTTEWGHRYWAAHWELPSLSQGFEMLHRLRPGRTTTTFTADDLDLLMRTADIAPYFRPRLKQITYNPYTRVDVRRMYKAGVITEDEVYQTYLDLGYDETHAKALKDFTISWATGEDSSLTDKQTDLTESLLSNMYNKGIIDENIYRSELAKLKYPSQYIDWLVLYTQSKRTVDTTPDEYDTYQTKMRTEVIAAYTARQITAGEATQALQGAGYNPQSITWLLQAADYDYQQGSRNETIKLIADSYITKLMTRTQAVEALGKINVSGAEQTQLLSVWDNTTQYRTKRLSESDYTSALRLGIISQDKYIEDLQGLGLSDDDITVKLALYQAAQTQAQADEQAQQQKLEQTAAKKLSVTDLLDAYAKGAVSEDQLYTRLQAAGFTTDDISLLISTRYNAPKPTQSKLTVTQIMTAFKRGALTEGEVRSMLTARGYTAEDIDILFASQATGAAT